MRKLSLFIFLMLSAFCYANNYMFKHIEVKDGLSSNQINSIFKDKSGYMWFSTASGLNRYDGKTVKVFRSSTAENGPLADNYVEQVQEDADGNLWINTLKGYSVYNPLTETFSRNTRDWMINYGISGEPEQIYIASNNDMWIYIKGKAIYLLKPETKLVYSAELGVGSIPKDNVMDMVEGQNELLVVYGNGTIVSLNKSDASFRWIDDKIAKAEGKGKYADFSLFVDNKNNAWIYGPLGLWVYNLKNRKWDDKRASLVVDKEANDMVHAIAMDDENNIWIGNDQGGITIYNTLTSAVSHLKSSPNDDRSLRNNNITSFYYDDKGTMWVGTYKKGISFYNKSTFKFGIDHIGDINCIEEGNNGSLWLGTNDAGLINWNRNNNEVTTYVQNKGNSLSSNTVVCLLRDRDNSLWVGTFWGGLSHLVNGKFITYKNDPKNENSLANNNVWALAQDNYGKIWIGTLGGGLQSFDPANNKFKTYNLKSGKLPTDYISSIFISGNDMVVGTSYGISLINIKEDKILNLVGSKSGSHGFSSLDVGQVYKDSRGLIWIGTREGLNIYNPKTDEIKILRVKDGLSSDLISGIVEDSDKNMWISTSNGVTNISLMLDKKSGAYVYSFVVYDDNDGLQNAEFNQRSIKALSNGDILMGGLYGVNYCNPHHIKHNKIAPNVIFTGISLFNQDVVIGEKYGKRVVLTNSLNSSRSMTLDYKQNVFTINVSSDDYVSPEKIKYYYKLEGFNDEWLVSNTGKITFTNLSADDYVLKVKAVNNDGFVGPEAELNITILPPFWLSTWAYIIYVLLIFGLIWVIRCLVIKRSNNALRIHKIETEAEKTKELNDLKTKFFVNISHELRTPLTMVITPLEALMKENEKNGELKTKLKVVHSNAEKLLDQVNQLLDFRKSEANSHQISLSDGDIIQFIKDITEKFRTIGETKKLRVSFFSNVSSLNISFDSDKMEKIINNLLSNAIKFTPDGGTVDVNVGLDYNDAFIETLEIKISDTGIGIKDVDKQRIFDRFYQVDNLDIESNGSGIGLSIVKDFVDVLKGKIMVYDNVPKGSVFVLEIPIKRSKTATKSTDEESSDSDGMIKPLDNVHDDVPYIHTIQEIRAAIAAGKLKGEGEQSKGDDERMNELGIDTVSTIKLQKATVIQLTEDGDNHYQKHIISSEDIPDYDPSIGKKKNDDIVLSDIAKDLMLDKDGKPKRKIINKPTILVVDDDVDFLQFMEETLSLEYNVMLAKNGNKAWTLVKENKPDLIICDLKMPQMNGKELCNLVKNDRVTSQIPFILLTSANSKEAEAEGLTDGADEFISKPFNIEILMLRMKKLMENKYNKFHTYIDPTPSNITITSMDEKLIDKAIKYIEDNISRSDFSVEELSQELGMSRVHLYKKLLAITGKTPIEFIRVIRLKRAAQFLRESQQNVSEIAYHVGFNNPKYFTKYFKEEYGILPSVYQENKGNITNDTL